MSMLLVPGFMLDADLWRDVEPALTEFGPLLHADLSQDSTIVEMAYRALSAASPEFVLVGFSMGGYVAREIVRQAPERVTALVLIATSARGDSEIQVQRKAAIAMQKDVSGFKSLSASAVASSLHPNNAGRSDFIARIQEMGHRLGGETFRRQSLLERRDERDGLGAIKTPTLVIAGEQDKLRSRMEVLELHQGLVGSAFETIENTGHMIPLEEPHRLAEIIRHWLSRQ
ncbi:Pimeloyl-[acyl-carrier protein] methyl ester esterase [Ensifer sp. M14]|uniref:alpha/beta fold hydrolase n=1 Tax=Ensifer sp. M14 TaxID=2203782 RepID=UPI000E1DBFAE|nr:alpha/beta hydrolase [Ensifer sp. M14]RDL46478.1 Pimeloyl-[acyl-carrier protein] methyl ester esterase [Ensifer sp. M14]